jgi:thioredoxin-like negative regulator of GroEL
MNKLLLLLLLLPTTALSQSFLELDELDAKKSKGITVVEFWAEWNKSNEVAFLNDLSDCRAYRMCIDFQPKAVGQYSISSVPTVVVFDNGLEVLRFNPTIMMQLAATKDEIQEEIDDIILKKFQ